MSEHDELVDDLADVLSRMVVGWKNVTGIDLSEHPDVIRVMKRYRESKANPIADFVETQLGVELQPWQKKLMMKLMMPVESALEYVILVEDHERWPAGCVLWLRDGKVVAPDGTEVPIDKTRPPDGRLLSREQYPKLYAVIGDAYGAVDDEFRLPDMRGKTVK